jgi:cyclophilin family peptidyl-prolyl cis-trans isomerase
VEIHIKLIVFGKLKSSFEIVVNEIMRTLIFLFLLCNISFAQYSSKMFDLIKTTYERSFNKEIINKYLSSNSEKDVNAALLSISQSEDTSFVPSIAKLDLNQYDNQIYFTLGQIGKCDQSLKFLWNILSTSSPPNSQPNIFFALGKIGSKDDLEKLINYYSSINGSGITLNGFSNAVLQFQNRGIKDDIVKNILMKEALSNTSKEEKLIALFTLARYGVTEFNEEQFYKLLQYHLNDDSIFNASFDQVVLMNINKPININYKILNQNFTSEIERFSFQLNLAKVLHFIHFKEFNYPQKNLDIYFELLGNKNENIALQSAVSLKKLKGSIPDSLIPGIKNHINEILFDKTKSEDIHGELLLTAYELFSDFDYYFSLLNKLDLPAKYKILFLSNNPDKGKAFNYLSGTYLNSNNLNDKINTLTELLNIKKDNSEQTQYIYIVKNALSSSYAPLISIAADGLDSSIIFNQKSDLKNIIYHQIDNYKNNPDYIEAIMSLINLSAKIDSNFYNDILSLTSKSELYSIRKFLATKTEKVNLGNKDLPKFEEIWSNAFKYQKAIIKTTKGDIEISFNSGIAPISVANFCMLANTGFYNEIIFHRVVPGFVIQAGDPTSTGWGGPGYDIVSEFSDSIFNIGSVGMASSGKDTEGSQFFIMQGFYPHLDSRYTLFATIDYGLDVITKITQSDKILSIDLME